MPAVDAPDRRWTLEEFHRMRDAAAVGPRYELVDGELLVTPSPAPTHQRIVLRLTVELDAYVRREPRLGEIFFAPLDVTLDRLSVLQPDILLVPPPVSDEIERWRPDDERPEVLTDRLMWHPDGASAPFDLDLLAFFAMVRSGPANALERRPGVDHPAR